MRFAAAVGGDCDLVGDAGEIGGEGIVRAADRLPHALGVLHDRLALGDKLVDQAADAELVVGVGALERGDLVVHQHFELARPRERPLDAVAHGRHFAADRLADGDDRFLGDVLRLGEAERHFRHGARHHAHFLAAPDENGDAPEEQDRAQDADCQAEQLRRRSARPRRCRGWRISSPHMLKPKATPKPCPGEGEEKRGPERACRRGDAAAHRAGCRRSARRRWRRAGCGSARGPCVRWRAVSLLARFGGVFGAALCRAVVGAPVPVAILFTFCATPATGDWSSPPLKSIFSASSTA